MFKFLKNKRSKKLTALQKKRIWTYLGMLMLIGCGLGLGMLVYIIQDLPAWNVDKLSGNSSTLIYDDKNQVVSQLHGGENRIEVDYDKIPANLINAFLAIEDQDFYKHHGVNFKGIARSLVANITSGDLKGQGASTITQQLARNAFLSFEKSWERKIKEIILAFKLESQFSKDEIMTMYLNKINFGAGAYGVQAAANTYFNKDISKVSLAEASLLAGLVQGPSIYNPFQHMDRAKSRQQLVLNNMVNCGYISEAEAKKAYEAPINLVKGNNTSSKKPYGFYVDAVVEEAIEILSNNSRIDNPETSVYTGALKIYTAMDSKVQAHAEQLYADPTNFPNQKDKNGKPIQSAFVVIKHDNGEVKALIGGREYTLERGFNRATSAFRQPGSSIKPITVYSPALEHGMMPFTVFDDSPISYQVGNTTWAPKNYDLSYRGLITMRTAVQHSINTYAVQCVDSLGIRTCFDFGVKMGLPLSDKPGINDLSLAPLALGGLSEGVTPLQMAAAYGAIGNKGVYVKPHLINKIVNQDGVVLYEYKPNSTRVMKEETAWLMTNMMQTVVAAGTATSAKVPGVPTAAKTGTSEELTNAWLCGLTPIYSAAVWMGFDNQAVPMNQVYGGGYPARLFRNILQKAHENIPAGNFEMPGNIVKVSVCSKDGKLPSDSTPESSIISEYCVQDFIPTQTSDIYRLVTICNDTEKIAAPTCPYTSRVPRIDVGPGSADKEKIPVETCDIHQPLFKFKIPADLEEISIDEHKGNERKGKKEKPDSKED